MLRNIINNLLIYYQSLKNEDVDLSKEIKQIKAANNQLNDQLKQPTN